MGGDGWRAIGGAIGLAVGLGIGIPFAVIDGAGGKLIMAGIALAAVLILYLVARPGRSSGRQEFCCGWLLMLNAVFNGVLLGMIFTPVLGMAALVPALAMIGPVSRNDIFQGFIGWMNMVLPMSWIVSGLGLVFMLASLTGWAVTGGRSTFLRVTSFTVDWKTGTFFTVGGIGGNANLMPGSPGYNMGNFAFLRGSATVDAHLVEHEAGHTLNLAGFGFIFHFIGAIDENLIGSGAGAYSELFAESNVPSGQRLGSILPLWGV